MSRASTPVRQTQSIQRSPTSIPRPAKGSERKYESLTKSRPLSRLSTASPSPSVSLSNPRSSSRLSFIHRTYASNPSSLSSSPFQSEIGDDERFSKGKKSRIPKPIQSRQKGYKVKSRKYIKNKRIDTLLIHLCLYYRTKHMKAQIERSYIVVEHQIPTRYMDSSIQLTPPPSRSRDDARQKAFDISHSPKRPHSQPIQTHRPLTPVSPPHSLPNPGHLSPSLDYSLISPVSEVGPSIPPEPVERQESPVYCGELSTSPVSSSPPQRLFDNDPPHAPAPVPNTVGTILLPIAEVPESQTGASSYPRRRKCPSTPISIISSEASGHVAEQVAEHVALSQPLTQPESATPQLEPVTESRASTPCESFTVFKVTSSASEILHRDKRNIPERAMSVASVASCVSIADVLEAEPAVIIAKGEFSVLPSKTTETAIGGTSAATGELQKIDNATKRTRSQSSVSAEGVKADNISKRGTRLWGLLSRWMGW